VPGVAAGIDLEDVETAARGIANDIAALQRHLGNGVDQDRREGLALDVAEQRALVPSPRARELSHLERLEEDGPAGLCQQAHVLVEALLPLACAEPLEGAGLIYLRLVLGIGK